MKCIELINISKEYKLVDSSVFALKDINFTINNGDFISLAGPSGSGKTTLLNIIGGLIRPTTGQCIVEGEDIIPLSSSELASYRFNKIV